MLTRGLVLASLVAMLAVATASSQPARDPTLKTGPFKDYHRWARMNATPVFSATHGNSFVVTYVNPTGLPAARAGKFPFPAGAAIVKEAFENQECRPGQRGAVFAMEKREARYDPEGNDWHWVRYNPDGTLWGEGKSGGPMNFCRACHSVARVNDFVFGNGTSMKVSPTMPPTPCAK